MTEFNRGSKSCIFHSTKTLRLLLYIMWCRRSRSWVLISPADDNAYSVWARTVWKRNVPGKQEERIYFAPGNRKTALENVTQFLLHFNHRTFRPLRATNHNISPFKYRVYTYGCMLLCSASYCIIWLCIVWVCMALYCIWLCIAWLCIVWLCIILRGTVLYCIV